MERKGDTEKRPRTSMGKPVKPHNSIQTFHSLYFLTSSSPFKALIRISHEKLNTMSIVNQLQTAFKTVSGENTHVIFFFLNIAFFFFALKGSFVKKQVPIYFYRGNLFDVGRSEGAGEIL